MYIKNLLIHWYIGHPQRLPQRPCGTGMIQTIRLVHYELVNVDATLVAGESATDHMVPIAERKLAASQMPNLLVPDGRMTSGRVCDFRVFKVALDDMIVNILSYRLEWFLV